MNTQSNDVQSVLRRVERLERQNRRLIQIALGGFALLLAACALSAGGQQKPASHDTQEAPDKPPYWRLGDGRLVVFPSSVKVEQVDAAALDLPPGTKVIGWEPVESANSLLPRYAERVATIPTVKGKLDALANAAGILQAQLDSRDNLTNQRIDLAFGRLVSLEKRDDELTNVVNVNAAAAGNADGRLRMATIQLDDLKRELDRFKEAACPILRTANVGRGTRMELDYACGLH